MPLVVFCFAWSCLSCGVLGGERMIWLWTDCASGAFAFTTTRWRLPPLFFIASNEGNTPKPNIMAGMSKVKIMKALVRTRSRYSRRAIKKTFFRLSLCIALPHHFDEDLFQGRLHQLELVDPRMVRHRAQ